jgi:hypothetical protein
MFSEVWIIWVYGERVCRPSVEPHGVKRKHNSRGGSRLQKYLKTEAGSNAELSRDDGRARKGLLVDDGDCLTAAAAAQLAASSSSSVGSRVCIASRLCFSTPRFLVFFVLRDGFVKAGLSTGFDIRG